MELIAGAAIIFLAAAVAIWTNDNLPVGDYITDEIGDRP